MAIAMFRIIIVISCLSLLSAPLCKSCTESRERADDESGR